MKEVKIMEVRNGYIVEYFDHTEIYQDFRDVITEIAKYYEEVIPLKV